MAFVDRNFIAKVQHTLDRYRMLEDGITVVVAVSGGPDSVALLHALVQLTQRRYPSLTLHVVHLNHRLRGRESDADEQFVQDLATKLDLKCTSIQQDIRASAQEQKRNLEEVAREARYRFLRDVADRLDARRIATGHTLTDQAETVLMRLVRGAGAAGLSGIHPVVDDLIIRPLLGVTRAEVLAYCQHMDVPYRVDRTNLETPLFRNRIRHELFPKLTGFNPSVAESLARAAENLRLDEDYFDQIVAQLMPDCLASHQPVALALNIAPLRELHPAVRHRVLRAAIRQLRGDTRRISQLHLEAVENLIISGTSGQRVYLPGLTAWREFDVVTLKLEEWRIERTAQELITGQVLQWGQFQLRLCRGLTGNVSLSAEMALLDDDKLPQRLRVRARRPGDCYIPIGHHQPRKLKRLMLERKIPVSERALWPLIVSAEDDQIIWGPRLPVAAPFAPSRHTERFASLQWVMDQK